MIKSKVLNALRGEIISITAKQRELEERRELLVAQLRNECMHEAVIETPYQGGEALSNPPRRLCVICGLEEEGWGSGYKKLGLNIPIREFKDRNEFYRYRELRPLTTVVVPEGMFAGEHYVVDERDGA